MPDAKNWNKPNENTGDAGKPNSGTGGGQTGSTSGTLSDIASKGKEHAQETLHSAREGMEHAAEKVQRWAHDAYDASAEGVGQAAEKVQKWAGDAYDVTSEKVSDFGQEVTSFVKRNPIPALLIGFGVGMLIGRATSRA
jgi:ElaB/YqjD/DUF883 family membrane-anchored ribosome-binding protein